MGAEPDAACLEQSQGRDQAPERLDRGDAGVGALPAVVGAGLFDANHSEERGLPRRSAETVTGTRVRGHLDRVGTDDRRGCEVEPRDRHLHTAKGNDHLDLAGLGLAGGLQLLDRRLEPVVVKGEVGAVEPKAAEEREAGELGTLARLGRDGDPHLLEIGSRQPGGLERRAGGAEGIDGPKLASVVANEALGQRLIAA